MSKKRGHAEEHENLERWLVSYADFMTLLFATFVVLYALSQLDLAKFKELQISIQRAFSGQSVIAGGEGVMKQSGANSVMNPGQTTDSDPLPPIFDYIKSQMEKSSFEKAEKEMENLEKQNPEELKGVDVKVNERGLVFTFVDTLLFDSGSATIKSTGMPALMKVGNLLKTKFSNKTIRVEGHTDDLPMRSDLYPSNWELSSARASSIIRFLTSNFDLSKDRFSAIGYAETMPIVPNTTEEGRKKNRRVEIVVLKDKLGKNESKPYDTTGMSSKQSSAETTTPPPVIKAQQPQTPPQGMSSAAKELMKETGQSAQNVFTYKDAYDKESEKLANELKTKEQQSKKDYQVNLNQ